MINQWVRQELEKTQLGDARRTNRFMKIVSNLSDKPTSSIPEASGTWAETKATYDFWDSPYIKPAQLRKGHADATLSRIENHPIILAIQDTTELNYTTHKAVKGAGYLDSKYADGLKVHSTLAATTQGLPLGIIDQHIWARSPKFYSKKVRNGSSYLFHRSAVRLLYLTHLARLADDASASCEIMLEPPEWQALYATIHHKSYPHSYPPTLGEAVGWIAKLGGFLGRKHDGFPGVKTLWRGLRRLDDIMTGWLLFNQLKTT